MWYTDETTSLGTHRWEMSASVVILKRRLKTMFLLEASQNQTQFFTTGAVVDFSSVAPVSKNRPWREHSSSEIATFSHDPASESKNLAPEAWFGQ